MGSLSSQEYWSELPCPPLGDLPDPGIQLKPPALQMDSLPLAPPGKPTGEAPLTYYMTIVLGS